MAGGFAVSEQTTMLKVTIKQQLMADVETFATKMNKPKYIQHEMNLV